MAHTRLSSQCSQVAAASFPKLAITNTKNANLIGIHMYAAAAVASIPGCVQLAQVGGLARNLVTLHTKAEVIYRFLDSSTCRTVKCRQ